MLYVFVCVHIMSPIYPYIYIHTYLLFIHFIILLCYSFMVRSFHKAAYSSVEAQVVTLPLHYCYFYLSSFGAADYRLYL